MAKAIDWQRLREFFSEDEIEWRKGGGGHLAYIDARALQRRLDDVLGPAGWQVEMRAAEAGVLCGLGIEVDGAWVWKWDGSDPRDEMGGDRMAFKAACTGAFKRVCASGWGIGRYLYDMPVSKGRRIPPEFLPTPPGSAKRKTMAAKKTATAKLAADDRTDLFEEACRANDIPVEALVAAVGLGDRRAWGAKETAKAIQIGKTLVEIVPGPDRAAFLEWSAMTGTMLSGSVTVKAAFAEWIGDLKSPGEASDGE